MRSPAARLAELTGPELTGPELTGPELTGPELTRPELTGPEPTGPELAVVSRFYRAGPSPSTIRTVCREPLVA